MIDHSLPKPPEIIYEQQRRKSANTTLNPEQIRNLENAVQGAHVIYLNLLLDGNSYKKAGDKMKAKEKYMEAATSIENFLRAYGQMDLFPQLKISQARAYFLAEEYLLAYEKLKPLVQELVKIYKQQKHGEYESPYVKFDGDVGQNLTTALDEYEEAIYLVPRERLPRNWVQTQEKKLNDLMKELRGVRPR